MPVLDLLMNSSTSARMRTVHCRCAISVRPGKQTGRLNAHRLSRSATTTPRASADVVVRKVDRDQSGRSRRTQDVFSCDRSLIA